MNVLSVHKTMTASSTKGEFSPAQASDDDIRTWWSAQSGKSGEWLQMDLGRAMSVEALQVCFADEGFKSFRFDKNVPTYKYIVEGSKDGKSWHTILDRANNTKDQIVELYMLPKADQVRYLRVTNKAEFAVGQFWTRQGKSRRRCQGFESRAWHRPPPHLYLVAVATLCQRLHCTLGRNQRPHQSRLAHLRHKCRLRFLRQAANLLHHRAAFQRGWSRQGVGNY